MTTNQHRLFHAELCHAVDLQDVAVRPGRSEAAVDDTTFREFNRRQPPDGSQMLHASGQQRLVALHWPLSMEFEPTTVVDIISRLVQVLPIDSDDQAVVQIDDAAAALALLVDRIRFRQALLRLCVNARAAVNSDGVIRINAHVTEEFTTHQNTVSVSGNSRRGSHVAIRISDMGRSIPVNLRNLLFEPLHAIRCLDEEILIERTSIFSIVRSHGGWIEFENAFDVGTTFTVNLPVVETPSSALSVEQLERRLNSIANRTSRRL